MYSNKRIGLSARNKRSSRGSLSVEASLVFPIFLLSILTLCCLFFYIQKDYMAAKHLLLRARLESVCVMRPEGSQDFVVKEKYSKKPIFSLIDGLGQESVAELKYRYFTGQADSLLLEEDNQVGDDTVYVTPSGGVYHTAINCSYLLIHIRGVLITEIELLRNSGGGKYSKCELCGKGRNPDVVYLTEDGRRFHYKSDCMSLKRTVKQISISEASEEGRRCCKRCQERDGK